MNTLLGELATLNDIQYPRYRLAFKLRKLQKSLLLDQLDLSTLQESLHLSGVGGLSRKTTIPVSQLLSSVSELYSCLRLQRPVLNSAQVQQAQELCSTWLQMNYQCHTGGKVEAGSLKVTLCILAGTKAPDKARYLFSVLANTNGAVECCDLAYFCTVTQQMAGTLQEQLYVEWEGPEKVWRSCLVFVRSEEDVEDEECDGGGIRRQWLSQFEFTKVFSSVPEPAFLSWMALYQRLPSVEKVVHPIRCAVCTRKPIVAFRYQCTQCNNFSLCQMCFLKGRVTGKHTEAHEVMEFSSSGKGQKSWHIRFLGSGGHPRGGNVWKEPKAPFVYSPRTSVASLGSGDHGNQHPPINRTGSPMQAIEDMLSSSQKYEQTSSNDHTHKPTNIRVGGKTTTSDVMPAQQKRSSLGSSCSPDSVSSASEGKFSYDPPASGASARSSVSDLHGSPGHITLTHNAVLKQERVASDVDAPSGHVTMTHNAVLKQEKVRSASMQHERKHVDDLAEINRRLSMEVDMLLNDLPSSADPKVQPRHHSFSTLPSKVYPKSFPRAVSPLHSLQVEGKVLEGQLSSLNNKREKLAGELEGLISQVQSIQLQSENMSRGIRTPSPAHTSPSHALSMVGPAHSRSESLPAEAYLNKTPSPQGVSPLVVRKVYSPTHVPVTSPTPPKHHGSEELLSPKPDFPDPMAEFDPSKLAWKTSGVYPEPRLSMAW